MQKQHKAIFILLLFLINVGLSANNISYNKITNYSHGGSYTDFNKIILENNTLYSASKFALDIFSIENDENILISSTPFEGEIYSIHKFENIIMLQVARKNKNSKIENRFYQIDVFDSFNPRIITYFTDSVSSFKKITRLFNDKFVYHNKDAENENVVGLTFIDPFTFARTTIDMDGYTYYLKDNYFMRQNADDHSINDVYDFSDLGNIEHIATIPTPQGYNGICSVKPVSENLLIWLGFNSIILYDISDIGNAFEVGHYNSDINSVFRFACQLIGDKLIVGVASFGLELFDISNLANPTLIEYYEIYNWSSIVRTGNRIYFAGDFEISVLELDDDSLYQVNSISTDIQYSGKAVNANDFQYLAGFYYGLYCYNLSNPGIPYFEECLFPEDYITSLNSKDNKLYVTHYNNDLEDEILTIFDISDAVTPEIIYEIILPNATSYSKITEEGEFYCISTYPSILQKFSIEEVIFLEFSTPITTGLSYVINGDFLYIAELENSNQLSIYSGLSSNFLNLENTISNFINDMFNISKIGNYLSLSSQFEEGFIFYSLDNPTSPIYEFELDLKSMGDADIKNNILFVDAFYTLYMYDLTDLNFIYPDPISEINLESMYKSIQFNDDYFYIIQKETITSFEYNIVTDNTNTEIKPIHYKLNNFPNPFNPTTEISYFIPNDTKKASIEIFNIKGQKIKSIECKNLAFGKHNVNWNGEDKNNQVVCSGVYFYKLIVNETVVSSNKMMLLK